jgi:hypothetical protein
MLTQVALIGSVTILGTGFFVLLYKLAKMEE